MSCPTCGHPKTEHEPETEIGGWEPGYTPSPDRKVCVRYAGMGDICGCDGMPEMNGI